MKSPAESRAERGVAVPLVAISLVALVVAASFTVDLGRWMNRSRDLQLVADIAALDAARQLDGRSASAQQPTIEAAASASARRNGFDHGDGGDLTVRLGYVDDNGEFVEASGSEVPTAVEVTAGDSVPFLLQQGAKSTSRRAVATSTAIAGIELGSGLVGDDGTCSGASPVNAGSLNSTLGALLGVPLSLDAVSYQGLACTRLTLGDLALAAGVGDVAGLLDLDLSLAELLTVAANAARADDGSPHAAVAASALDSLAALAAGLALPNVSMGDIIAVDGGSPNDFTNVTLGLGHLVQGALYVARDGHVLSVPGLSVAVPGLLGLSVSLGVVEPPQIVIGPTGSTVRTAQVRLRVDATVAEIPLVGTVRLPLIVEAAAAETTLMSVACGGGVPTDVGVHVSTAGARVMIGQMSDAQLGGDADVPPSPAPIVSLLGIPVLSGATTVSVAGIDEMVHFSTDEIGVRRRVHGDLSLDASGSLALAGIPLDAIVFGVLEPALDLVLGTVVTPLLDALGVHLSYADVTVFDPVCPQPRLIA